MKKITALLLTISMFATVLVGCDSEEQANNTQTPKEVTSVQETAIAETTPTSATIVETVVYDADGIKITATGIERNTFAGTDVKFLVENSTDKNIALTGTNFVLNGITITGYFHINVAAGKKANGAVEFFQDRLSAVNITEIATFSSRDSYIYDTDSYETLCHVPFSLETTANGSYTQFIDDSGDVIFDQDGVTVIAKNLKTDSMGKYVYFLVKNNTGKDIIFEGENISVNGFTLNAWLYDVIYTDTVRLCEMEILSSSLQENGIEEIEDLSFSIRVIEDETYSRITKSDEIQLSFT